MLLRIINRNREDILIFVKNPMKSKQAKLQAGRAKSNTSLSKETYKQQCRNKDKQGTYPRCK